MLLKALFLVALASATNPSFTILQNAKTISSLSTLVSVLSQPQYSAVANALNSPGTLTLFAPNDAAFAASNVNPNNVSDTTAVLYYHTLGATVKSTDLSALQFPHTLISNPAYVNIGKGVGQALDVAKSSGVTTNWGIPGVSTYTANVVQADIISSNGVIHIIDKVQLLPALTSTTAKAAGLNTLLQAVSKAGLVSTVDDTPAITVFAPTDAAFAAAGIDPNKLTPEQLTPVLAYHVVPNAVGYSTTLSNGETLPTLQGGTLKVSLDSQGVHIVGAQNTANVVVANALTQNGVVHVIDAVLLPPSAIEEIKRIQLGDPTKTIVENAAAIPDLSTLVAVLTSPGYEPILNALNSPGTYTVFAPNNAAFAAATGIDVKNVTVTSDILLYHTLGVTVLSNQLLPLQFPHTLSNDPSYVNLGPQVGQVLDAARGPSGVTINWAAPIDANATANVIVADIICSNGVIHIIDRVALLPQPTSTTATTYGLTTLVQAVVKAGLASAVDNTAAITVFAPTNQAFTNAGIDPNQLTPAQLSPVLLYHVVPAVAYSTDLVQGEKLPTLQNEPLTINLNQGGVVVSGVKNKANVIIPNVLTKNGVVHVIDAVLLP